MNHLGFAEKSRPTRRTIVLGAAWSVPAVTVCTTLPAFAASGPCPSIAQTDWSAWVNTGQGLTSGSLNGWTGTTTHYGVAGFWSVANNAEAKDTWTDADLAYVTTEVIVPVAAGVTYTFAFDAGSGWGNNRHDADTRYQTVDVLVNGVSKWTGTTADGGNLLPSNGVQHLSFSYTAAAGETSIVLTYKFTLPPAPAGQTANDDICISSPVITCA